MKLNDDYSDKMTNDQDIFRLSYFDDEYKTATGLDSLKSAMSESFVFQDSFYADSESSDDEYEIYSQDSMVGDFHVLHSNAIYAFQKLEKPDSGEVKTPTKALSVENISNTKVAAIATSEDIGFDL